MRRFFCDSIPENGHPAILDDRELDHIFKILRMRTGDEIFLMDGKGVSARSIIEDKSKIIIMEKKSFKEPCQKLHLFFSSPRRHRLDDMIRQCAEMGVWSMTPLVCERSVAVPGKDVVPERWKLLLAEGCKQSGNPFLPQINRPLKLREAVEMVGQNSFAGFYGDVSGDNAALPVLPEKGEIAWVVGPEGGFTESECRLMMEAGLKGLRMGDWTMRIETAALCGASLFIFLMNGMAKN